MYPPIPTIEPQRADESEQAYRVRTLRFVLAHDTTATLTDSDLQGAQWAALFVLAAREISDVAIDKIANVQRLITATLRNRAIEDSAPAAVVPTVADTRPNDGPMAPLKPRPIVRPPAPAYAAPRPPVVDIAF